MKLLTKLTLFTTLSKVALLLIFIAALPYLIDRVASNTTNYQLSQQEKKVFSNIREKGIDYYLEGDSSYASYTMLKEEYISLATADIEHLPDTLMTARRIIENDTLTYRILSRNFEYNGRNYNLEIAKTISSISQYNRPLQRIALYVMASLIVLILLADLGYTRVLLKPLASIIRTRITNNRFPFRKDMKPVVTTTTDFRSLDKSLADLMRQVNLDFEREREFTSNASHELMTPISILQTKMENLLLDSESDEVLQARLLDQMKTLNRLKKIVNGLMLISRIGNEQYKRSDNVYPATLIQEVTEELSHRIEQRDITLEVSIRHNPEIAAMNHDLLFQLVYNLINNAIRYNKDSGTITISDRQEQDMYVLEISDTGVGIEPAELPRIFDRFKKSGTEHSEGYGLGLSIVKSIAAYLRIRIDVSSTPGAGTSFSLRFPMRAT